MDKLGIIYPVPEISKTNWGLQTVLKSAKKRVFQYMRALLLTICGTPTFATISILLHIKLEYLMNSQDY